jgi:hypothetical protein
MIWYIGERFYINNNSVNLARKRIMPADSVA